MRTSDDKPKKYWFRAMRYGWGWSLPLSWEGWVIFIAYLAAIFAGIYLLPPEKHKVAFTLLVLVSSLVLVAICWVKGEPLKWRWGRNK